jgi:hypothetical protein
MKAITGNILFAVALILTSCGKGEEPLPPNQKTEDLLRAQVWEHTETLIDNTSSNLYDGLTLSFGSKTYTTTNGGSLWPPSGTWDFVGDDGTTIVRDDGLIIEILRIDGAELVMMFNWDSKVLDGGRSASLKGKHQMTFRRK